MNTGIQHNEWARGGLFLLASLTTAWYGSGYMFLLHPLANALLLAQLYALLAVLAPYEWRSRRYQMVGVGLVLAAAPFLLPAGVIPSTPPVIAAIGAEDWGQVLFVLGGASIAIGGLSYAVSLFLAPPPTPQARKKARSVRQSYRWQKGSSLRPAAVPTFSVAARTL